jgi:NADH:ubiquinone oxidoreductase subunit 6 (subunit J)
MLQLLWLIPLLPLAGFAQDAEAKSVSSVARIGGELFTQHAFAFEATSILILVAMVGAVVLARREH